jgi:hypothetical protein
MTRAWMIVRVWDDECVVHHALSNETHRLVASAARILIELAATSSGSASTDGPGSTLDDAEALEVLQVLSRLELVTRC